MLGLVHTGCEQPGPTGGRIVIFDLRMRLRSSLIALVVATALPLVAFGFVVAALLVQHEQDNFVAALKDRNRAFMSAVDAELKGHIRALQTLSSVQSLRENDLRRFHASAVAALRTQTDWEDVILNAPDGQQLMSAVLNYNDPLPAATDHEAVQKIVRTRQASVVSLRIRPLTHTLAIPVQVPVLRDGRVVYVLTAVVHPESFQRLIRAQNLPPGWVSGLVDADNRFIARTPPRPVGSAASPDFAAAVERSNAGWYRGRTAEGFDTYTAFLKSELTGWSIGLALPSEVVSRAQSVAGWTAVGATLCIILSVLMALWIGRRIAEPITRLARSVGALDAQPDLAVDTHIQEVRDFSVALKRASEALIERRTLAEEKRRVLEQSDRAKDEFLAMLSHELRNPLAGIVTASQLLKMAPPGSEVALSAQRVIDRQAQQMTRLVEDLLDVSRITIGKAALDLQPVELSELVTSFVESWQKSGRLARHVPAIEVSGPVWVLADRARIEQVLANLLDNAVKFSPAGTRLWITVQADSTRATLVVSDEGAGIAPDQLNAIFDLFVQGPQDMSRQMGGLGIGLAISRRIVELHGGTITAHSEGLGKGSRFALSLARIEPPRSVTEQPVNQRMRTSARRVLLVEDNDDARDAMADLIRLLGHVVDGTPSGAAGIRMAQVLKPDVVFVDIGLPDMDGYAVAREIRAAGSTATLVALTGYGQTSDKVLARAAGFEHHITKPLSAQSLEQLLG